VPRAGLWDSCLRAGHPAGGWKRASSTRTCCGAFAAEAAATRIGWNYSQAAAEKYDIGLASSHIVGDRWRDVLAGQAVGCRTIYVDYGFVQDQPATADQIEGRRRRHRNAAHNVRFYGKKPHTWPVLLGISIVIIAMLVSIVYVATGRTALVVFLALLILLAMRKLRTKGVVFLVSGAILVGGIGWQSSPYLRNRTEAIWTELEYYKTRNVATSSGERLVFWTKSIDFIREAPFVGHGTGSIRSLYEKSALGQSGVGAEISTNPHNQTFAVGIQLGLIGVAVLWAMWIAHLLLFRGDSLAAWIGLILVVQNIVGSLFNSHLFDFTQGWVYVVGVGVAGGMAKANRQRARI